MVMEILTDAGGIVRDTDAEGLECRARGPMPESCRICGEPMDPAARITALRARATPSPRPSTASSTPAARFSPSRSSITSRRVWALVMTVRFARPRRLGRRNAFVALQRVPRRWFMWK